MANLYAKAAGGNWSAAGTWSTSSSAGVDNSGPPTSATDVILELGSGNVTVDATSNAKTVSCSAGTGNYAGVLTQNAFLTVAGSLTFVSGMTFTPLATTTIFFSATATLTTAGLLMLSITQNSGTFTVGDNLSFMASKLIVLTLGGTTFDMNGKTINGNSVTNRVLIKASALGTAKTITNATTSFTNADFKDITFSSASNLDLSAITGNSGDCGGNTITGGGTILTFTTPATQTWTGTTTDSWSTNAWTSRVPLPQDNAFISSAFASGQTITIDMPRMGKSVDFSALTSSGTKPIVSNNTTVTTFGSLILLSGITFSTGAAWNLEGRGSFILTNGGRSFAGNNLSIGMVGGTLTLQDALTSTSTITVSNGTFIDGGFTTSANIFASTGAATRALTLTGTISVVSTGTVWNVASSGLTLTSTGSTISVTNTSATAKTFAGAGLTYNNISIAGSGTGAVIFTGANTLNQLSITSGTKSITLPGSTTTTIISGLGLSNGTNIITFTASAGSATVSKSGAGTVSWDYINLTNIPAVQTSTFYAGTHSTDNGGNTNWVFTDPPGPATTSTIAKYRTLMGVGV